MLNRVDAQIDIKIWPVEMAGTGLFDIQNLPYWNIFEPRKILIREKKLLISNQKPKTMT